MAPGRVVGGRVEFDGELPEGATVAVLATDGDETFEVDAEAKRVYVHRAVAPPHLTHLHATTLPQSSSPTVGSDVPDPACVALDDPWA
jgi:hypothetical protein